MFTFTFNTGRCYQPVGHKHAGQVIVVGVIGVVVYFADLSRGLDGTFTLGEWDVEDFDALTSVARRQEFIREALMSAYDNNRLQHCAPHGFSREQIKSIRGY
jgi:hypothetical protein